MHFIGPETDHVRSTVLVIIHHLKFSYKIPIDLKVIFFTIDRKVTVKKKKKKKSHAQSQCAYGSFRSEDVQL